MWSLEPHLFLDQFQFARWLALPLCCGNHWILAMVDLQQMEVLFFNSLDDSTNLNYMKKHVNILVWVKYFLSWRFGKFNKAHTW
jgi:hypothetical protein